MDELVNLFNWDVHTVVGRDVTLKLQEVAADVVYVHEGKLLVDVVLGNVYIEMV